MRQYKGDRLMPHSKHFIHIVIGIVLLGMGPSRLLSADPPNEPLPTGAIGYSTPELTPTPEASAEIAPSENPIVFPYGAPLVGYENARTCWSHHYCNCRYSTCKRRAQCRAWGYPEEFCERPFGSCVRSQLHRQVANALADQMAIYCFDFFDEDTEKADQLKPRGVRQLIKVANYATMLCDQYYMVTIEATGNSELDHQRRIQVFENLTELGASFALNQVVTGIPAALGLDGTEAVEIYENQLQSTKQQGGTSGGSVSNGAASSPVTNSRAGTR
jgi:hypothetical protein